MARRGPAARRGGGVGSLVDSPEGRKVVSRREIAPGRFSVDFAFLEDGSAGPAFQEVSVAGTVFAFPAAEALVPCLV